MRRLSTFLLGVVTGAVLFYVATSFHVVRAQDGFHLVRKTSMRLPDPYVDIRSFSVGDWTEHPQLALAITQAGKQHLIGDSTTSAIQNGVEQALENWQ